MAPTFHLGHHPPSLRTLTGAANLGRTPKSPKCKAGRYRGLTRDRGSGIVRPTSTA
ncbi:hypothetical protein AVV32_gp01 [Pseudomonas phage PhiCHU]|uniref:Uncharacterized protein n=1 Tax=Pseudomonas phage PhiCHU TaxID=1589273 RepID=A0A0B5A405_9CAUD|nr:hypothetical protein AVV32_gp01 [Pseudomonas phage PhiCHU]AJD82694.1 hypothetical protein PhiCHU_01 [Pseudomonas phage PhiCHU]